MKKLLLIIFSISLLLFSNNAFANDNQIPESKIQEKIEENNKKIRLKLEEAIEKKLNFIEISETYKSLSERAKIDFYEIQLALAEKKLNLTKKEREIEIYEIFIEKVKARLQKLYGTSIEDEGLILEILTIE
jgi:hypothetical protein